MSSSSKFLNNNNFLHISDIQVKIVENVKQAVMSCLYSGPKKCCINGTRKMGLIKIQLIN